MSVTTAGRVTRTRSDLSRVRRLLRRRDRRELRAAWRDL